MPASKHDRSAARKASDPTRVHAAERVAGQAEVLGLGRVAESPGQFIGAINRGLSSAAVARLVKRGYKRGEVIQVIGPRSTIERKIKERKLLSQAESDRLARLARIIQQAEDTFGDMAKANHWLQRPVRGLDDGEPVPPIRLLGTDQGTRLVEDRLNQIAHGIFA